MSRVNEIKVESLSLKPYENLLGDHELAKLERHCQNLSPKVENATLWNINSTAAGGGVAEMLPTLIGYGKGLGFQIRWLVISGDSDFYAITKRIHNGIHASPGDGGSLGPRETDHFEKITLENFSEIIEMIKPQDVVLCHDPQTAGLVRLFKERGISVIWRSHIGYEEENELVERSWQFLKPFLNFADRFIFTRKDYAPKWIDQDKIVVIPPSIDAFSAKNETLSIELSRLILAHIGLIQCERESFKEISFKNYKGRKITIKRYADIVHAGPLPHKEDPFIVQVSRWDRLKDMLGVMNGFADYVVCEAQQYLALVGPSVHSVSDDPESVAAFNECLDNWRSLPHFKRQRILLVCLPMRDLEENAYMVNAIQTHATMIVQKSLYEGFGLTVSEAMWKSKAVIGTAVGGIKDQIRDQENGLLLKNPTDLKQFGSLVKSLLDDEKIAKQLAQQAKKTVKEKFLVNRHIIQYLKIMDELLS